GDRGPGGESCLGSRVYSVRVRYWGLGRPAGGRRCSHGGGSIRESVLVPSPGKPPQCGSLLISGSLDNPCARTRPRVEAIMGRPLSHRMSFVASFLTISAA